MERPSPSRIKFLPQVLGMLGLNLVPASDLTTGQIYKKWRGPAPRGRKYITGVFIPGGRERNVELTTIKNPKVAANITMMHDRWVKAKLARGKEVTP